MKTFLIGFIIGLTAIAILMVAVWLSGNNMALLPLEGI